MIKITLYNIFATVIGLPFINKYFPNKKKIFRSYQFYVLGAIGILLTASIYYVCIFNGIPFFNCLFAGDFSSLKPVTGCNMGYDSKRLFFLLVVPLLCAYFCFDFVLRLQFMNQHDEIKESIKYFIALGVCCAYLIFQCTTSLITSANFFIDGYYMPTWIQFILFFTAIITIISVLVCLLGTKGTEYNLDYLEYCEDYYFRRKSNRKIVIIKTIICLLLCYTYVGVSPDIRNYLIGVLITIGCIILVLFVLTILIYIFGLKAIVLGILKAPITLFKFLFSLQINNTISAFQRSHSTENKLRQAEYKKKNLAKETEMAKKNGEKEEQLHHKNPSFGTAGTTDYNEGVYRDKAKAMQKQQGRINSLKNAAKKKKK